MFMCVAFREEEEESEGHLHLIEEGASVPGVPFLPFPCFAPFCERSRIDCGGGSPVTNHSTKVGKGRRDAVERS